MPKDLVAASATPLVLGILSEGENYGYAILKRVNQLSSGELEWTDGMLYPLLHRLETAGLRRCRLEGPTRQPGTTAQVLPDHRVRPAGPRRAAPAMGRDHGHVARPVARDVAATVPCAAGRLTDVSPAGPGPPRSARPRGAGPRSPDRAMAGQHRAAGSRRRHRRGTSSKAICETRSSSWAMPALAPDEAFLIAAKRMGSTDALSSEFAQEHSDRLWKQLMPEPDAESSRRDFLVMIGFACLAAAAIKVPEIFGASFTDDGEFYARNVSLFALVPLAGYFVWHRGLPIARALRLLAPPFIAAAVAVNAYPFDENSDTEVLAALHLPIALWLLVGVAYAGGDWRSDRKRMDYVRFTGEWFIYFVLIALGGGVLAALTQAAFAAIDIDASTFTSAWLLPCGALAAVVVASWLVEAKQGVIENMAPVLTRLFTPLFAAMLLGVPGGHGVDEARDRLRPRHPDPLRPGAGAGPRAVALCHIGPRPQRALGPVRRAATRAGCQRPDRRRGDARRHCGPGVGPRLHPPTASPPSGRTWSCSPIWLCRRGSTSASGGARRPFAALERWQTGYGPVYAVWAAAVVVVFPPLFGFA